MRRICLVLLLFIALLGGCSQSPIVPQPPSESIGPTATTELPTMSASVPEARFPPDETYGVLFPEYLTTGELPLKKDLGQLYPYIVATKADEVFGQTVPCDFGLATNEGKIVIPGGLSTAYIAAYTDDSKSEYVEHLPVIILGRRFATPDGKEEERFAIADAHGMWITDFLLCNWVEITSGGIFGPAVNSEDMLMIDVNGDIRFSYKIDVELNGGRKQHYENIWYNNVMRVESKDGDYFISGLTGKRIFTAEPGCKTLRFSEGLAAVSNIEGLLGYIDTTGSWAIPPQYTSGGYFKNGHAEVLRVGEANTVINKYGDIVSEQDSGKQKANGDWVWEQQGVNIIVTNGQQTYTVPSEKVGAVYVLNKVLLVISEGPKNPSGDTNTYSIYGCNGNQLVPGGVYSSIMVADDMLSGESFLYGELESGRVDVFSQAGEVRCSTQGYNAWGPVAMDGILQVVGNDRSGLLSPEGEWLVLCTLK